MDVRPHTRLACLLTAVALVLAVGPWPPLASAAAKPVVVANESALVGGSRAVNRDTTGVRKYAFTQAHLNVYRKNSGSIVHEDVLRLTRRSSVLDLNEGRAQSGAIRRALREVGWKHLHYPGSANWLAWNPGIWEALPDAHRWVISKSARALGFPAVKFHPARDLVQQRLRHIASGTVHDFYATHLAQGYAKRPGVFPPHLRRLQIKQASEGVHRIDTITARRIRHSTVVGFDHLSGDFNSRQANIAQSWYPARALRGEWAPDTRPDSIDWIMHSRRSFRNGLVVRGRWSDGQSFHSDHLAHFSRVTFPGHTPRTE